MSDALNNLPPEMKARLAQIMAGQQAPAAETPHQAAIPSATQTPQPAPVVKPPSLMDHVIALRQEVAALRQESAAQSNVVDAVGQAVGQLYQMFQPSPGANAQGQTYSQAFQQSVEADGQDF
jgi:hypothetical protein